MRSRFLALVLATSIATVLALVGCKSSSSSNGQSGAAKEASSSGPAPEAPAVIPALDGTNARSTNTKARWCS